MRSSRRNILKLCSACVLGASDFPAYASRESRDWPRDPLKIIVPGQPGGILDRLTKYLKLYLFRSSGVTISLDYRPGAGGLIGARALAVSEPDGKTISVVPLSPVAIDMVVNKDRSLYRSIGFKGLLWAEDQILLSCSSRLPISSLKELINFARQSQRPLTFASPGIATTPHLAGEFLSAITGLNLIHVPYRNVPQSFLDVAEGRVDLAIYTYSDSISSLNSRIITPLALMRSKRHVAAPHLSSAGEYLKDFNTDFSGGFALVFPRKTPDKLADQIAGYCASLFSSVEMTKSLADSGITTRNDSPIEFQRYIETLALGFSDLIRTRHIRID